MYIAQQLRIGKYLGANIILWGIVMMLHVFPTNFGGFFMARFILGESFPSSLWLKTSI